ncbi:hypothetical protein EMCRGX_G032087 [Ephydatia muelleri]
MSSSNWCFNYSACRYNWNTCPKDVVHDVRYNDASAAWVLIAAIIVFFMKAGFMLVEVSFAKTVKERRNVVIIKHMDAFASAFGFFLIGFDTIARYSSRESAHAHFFSASNPLLWFFKFTFASNAATVVGGCLVTNTYKLRLPAAFISAFVISGIIHPIIVLIIWSDVSQSISPYRFCVGMLPDYNCTLAAPSFLKSMYVLDFAGSGAVHMLGGTFGLVLCLFAKLEEWRQRRRNATGVQKGTEGGEEVHSEGFWDWMYPVSGGDEAVSEAALGVIILWFAWFAFNCGSTESVETPNPTSSGSQQDPYYNIPAIIAINMIMAAASGGIIAILIATWAQVRLRASSINANEVANGVLSALVAITAGCPFVDYWGACLIGVIAVLVYHLGCWLEYRLDIKDTARVFPVHGLCGLWGLIGTGLLVAGPESECNLHATFEGLCYCELRLPPAGQGERILAQIVGSLIIFGIGLVSSVLLYGALYVIPINPFVWVMSKIFFLNPKQRDGNYPPPLVYEGGWLLTSPNEENGVHPQSAQSDLDPEPDDTEALAGGITVQGMRNEYGAVAVDGLQRRSRAGDEEASSVPRTPRSGPGSGTAKYGVKGKGGGEDQKLLLERSSDDKGL